VLLHQSVGRSAGDLPEVVDFHDVVCPGGEFTNELDGAQDFRPDGSHFSPGGADWVARWHGCWEPLRSVESPASGLDPEGQAPFGRSASMTGL